MTDVEPEPETPEPEQEEDLTSSSETAPKSAKPEASDAACPHCDKVYRTGPQRLRDTNLKNHIRHHHGTSVPAKQKGPKVAAAAKVVGPKPKPKARKSAAENIAFAFETGARAAIVTGHVPLANSLSFVAPAGGETVDGAIAGSMIDRKIVQPLQTGSEKWAAVTAVLSLPLMVHLLTIYPALQPALEPQMRRAAEEILIMSVPTIRRKAERNRELTEALSELGALDPSIAASEDPVGEILAGFFAEPVPAPDPMPADA
jgi:hypothetical protein